MTAHAEMHGDSISLRLGALLIRETTKQPRRTLSKTAQEDGTTTWFSLSDEGLFVAAEEDEVQNAETTLVVRTTSTSPTAWQRLLGQLGVPPFQKLETRTSTGIAWWDDIREEGDDRVVTHFRAPGEVRRESVPADERPRNIALTWPGIRAALEKKYPDSSAAQRLSKELRFFDSDDEILGECQVRDLIVAEPLVDGVEYVLTEGEVFRAASEYLAALDSFLEGLVVSPNRLPAYNGGHEGRYNEATGLALLDTQLISIEGSRFEPCDLVDDSGRLIFVKRRSRASVMSHLWAQIVTSAILLRRSSAVRAAFSDRLEAAGAPNQLLDTIDAGARDLTLVLSILGATDIRQLTLLARIPLRAAVQRLQDLGYTVEIELIPGPGAEAP